MGWVSGGYLVAVGIGCSGCDSYQSLGLLLLGLPLCTYPSYRCIRGLMGCVYGPACYFFTIFIIMGPFKIAFALIIAVAHVVFACCLDVLAVDVIYCSCCFCCTFRFTRCSQSAILQALCGTTRPRCYERNREGRMCS